MPRYAIYLTCHSGDELFSTWLSTRIAEWASLSGRAEELARERRQGWHFPVLVTQAHHAAFDRYLEDWLATRSQPQDEARSPPVGVVAAVSSPCAILSYRSNLVPDIEP